MVVVAVCLVVAMLTVTVGFGLIGTLAGGIAHDLNNVLAPIGMALSGATRISPFLMTLMIVNGANAGALSPLAPTGIIANGLVEKIHMDYIGGQIYLNSLLGNGVAAVFAFFAFGGLKLFGSKVNPDMQTRVREIVDQRIEPWDRKQMITMAAITAWIVLVLFLVGALPNWRHSSNWGYGPSGGLGLIVVILLVLLLLWLSLSSPAKIAGTIWMVAGIAFGAWKTRGFRGDLVNFDVPADEE